MKRIPSLLVLISGLLISACSDSPDQLMCGQVSSEIQERILADISVLAHDSLEGREAGTVGAQKAASFISSRFKQLGLKPVGDNNTYLQAFEFSDNVKSKITLAMVGQGKFNASKDLYALQFGASGTAENVELVEVGFGIEADDLDYNNYKGLKEEDLEGKAFVMDLSSPDGVHPHSAYLAYHDIDKRVKLAQDKGAAAVIVVNRGDLANDPIMDFKKLRNEGMRIPVVFARGKVDSLLAQSETVTLGVSLEESKSTGRNVVGMIDNNAAYTVVIGAHYDHLGYGGSGSLYRGEPAIHNGADDNASGTAGLMELASYYAQARNERVNYLFIAFTAEEKGLLGSNYFVKNSPVPTEKMAYMINMDMIGRMDSGKLVVNGVGTEERFASLANHACGLNLIMKESGSGPSDHTSFYLSDVPVLSLFTGSHEDYHKPTDDTEKLNMTGLEKVLNFVVTFNQAFADGSQTTFIKTADKDQGDAPRFSVTLGVVPDYLFDGKGMRIDGVNEGKPADKAGFVAGDIVVKMGDLEVVDMMSYMEGLSRYKKGDKVMVTVKRAKETIGVEVTF